MNYLESCWAPVNELCCFPALNFGYGSVDILWNDISSKEEATGHVFPSFRIALNLMREINVVSELRVECNNSFLFS